MFHFEIGWKWLTKAAYNPYGSTKIYFPTQLSIGAICMDIYYLHCENVSLINFTRVTGVLDLGKCLSLDADNLPSADHISPVQPGHDPSLINYWHFIFHICSIWSQTSSDFQLCLPETQVVCMCVCVWLCVYVSVCLYLGLCVCLSVCLWVCVSVCVFPLLRSQVTLPPAKLPQWRQCVWRQFDNAHTHADCLH